MKQKYNLLFLLLILILTQGCNTLYSTRTINIEVVVPGKISISPEFQKVAVRYNNSNVSQNPYFADYFDGNKTFNDTTNTDSIASEVYFQVFTEHLKNQNIFDYIIELERFDYSQSQIIDTITNANDIDSDTIFLENRKPSKAAISNFTSLLKSFPINHSAPENKQYINPEFVLYSKQNIQEIADSTNADLLLSLDYFAALDRTDYLDHVDIIGIESVFIIVFWNVYDLKKQELIFFYENCDTIMWSEKIGNIESAKKVLPPRKDAILNAADIAGTRFVEFLIPHWAEVERMYYKSGQVELKKTDELVKENKWLEAAEIWKSNIENPNKSIAAKCMFNLSLACEMEGDLDAAIDWTVKSFHLLEHKNEVHRANCMEYIRVLGQRKFDIKVINFRAD